MTVMKTLAFFPSASAYICTNGCGALREKMVSRSGVQNRKRIVVMKPSTPVAMALVNIPLAAITLYNGWCQEKQMDVIMRGLAWR